MNQWIDRLEAIGTAVRQALIAQRASGDDLAMPVAQEGGDTIFAIDRHVELVIEDAIARWPKDCQPLLIAEGFGHDGRRQFTDKPRYRLIVDPIDGTRNIMYDKRSAWFLAGVAHDRGEATTLADTFAAVMVELPPIKQGLADTFAAVRGQGVRARRINDVTGDSRELVVQPSQAVTLRNGFAQVANFFPGTKVLASELMERIAEASLGAVEPGSAAVFDDQYITTGGQMVELMVGHDRFCCDLRPLFYRILSRQTGRNIRGLECHPYDIAAMLVAQESGVVLTDGFGHALNAPLDVHTGIHWCGYANETLRQIIEPVIIEWLKEKECQP